MVLLASQYDQSRFFKAADLSAEKKLRIKAVTEEMIGMGPDKEQKLVVWFTNDEHGLVLNRINNRTIREAYGDVVDSWANKIITIFPTTAEFRGKMGPAIRVRTPPKQPSATVITGGAPAAKPPGNGGAAATKPATEDPELQPDPVKPIADELNDSIDF